MYDVAYYYAHSNTAAGRVCQWREARTGPRYSLIGERLPDATVEQLVAELTAMGYPAVPGNSKIGPPEGPPGVTK
jgi:hypothetical protein